MIAANFRKYAEAMALQLCLPFGKPRWNGARPTTRHGRMLRSIRAALIGARPQIVQWVEVPTPQWAKDAARRARKLANTVRAALPDLFRSEGQTTEWEQMPLYLPLYQPTVMATSAAPAWLH